MSDDHDSRVLRKLVQLDELTCGDVMKLPVIGASNMARMDDVSHIGEW